MSTFAPKGNIYGPILPEFVLKKSITTGAKLMYALLCNYASDKDHCWPSHARLAERLSCSISSVKNYLAELVRENLIEVRKEKFRPSVYYMIRPDDVSDSRKTNSNASQPKAGCQEPNFDYRNNFRKQEEINTPPFPPIESVAEKPASVPAASAVGCVTSSDQDFEIIWNLYPKKEAKGFARMAWFKLLKSGQLPSLQEITTSIHHFASSENWQREQGRFIPQMGNWLRGQRWLDTLPAAEMKEQKKQKNFQQAIQAQKQREQRELENFRAQKERLRPEYDAFAARFSGPFDHARALGTWMFLHSKNIAPQAEDVPADNTLGIIDFLEQFKSRRTSSPRMVEQRCNTARGHMTEPTICGALMRQNPVFAKLLVGNRELQPAL